MRKIIKCTIVLLAALSMGSCASAIKEKVSIIDVDNIEIMGFSGVKADIILGNESCYKIKIREVSATLKQDGSAIATLELNEGFAIPRRCDTIAIPTVWRLRDVNLLTALSASKKLLQQGNLDSFKVDIQAEVKVGPVKRELIYNNRALSEFIPESMNISEKLK